MNATNQFKNTLIGLGTVLLLVKKMHEDLIRQIETLPESPEREKILKDMRRNADHLTREQIMDQIRILYPDVKSMTIEQKQPAVEIITEEPEQKMEGDHYVR